MKKLVTLLVGLLLVASSAYATCIEILNFHWEYCSPGHYKAVVVYNNNTGSNRSFKVKVYDSNSSICFSDCVTALQGSRTYTSQVFSCNNPVDMSIKTYTGHNCNGQVCEYVSLPITLGYFNAIRKNDNNVILKWGTEIESNNDKFVIFRKTDKDFIQIGSVNTKAVSGNSSIRIEYGYIDNNNFYNGMSLYRLQQVDKDGKSSFTEIILVSPFKKTFDLNAIKIAPNPVKSGEIMKVIFSNTDKHSAILYGVNGNEVFRWNDISGNDFKLPNLSPGMYLFKVIDYDINIKPERIIILK